MTVILARPKILFVHICKNAGTSVSVALLKAFSHPTLHFRNAYLPRKYQRLRYPHLQSHMSISSISRVTGLSLSDFFTFAVVRNPWDWNLSLYSFILKDKAHHLHDAVSSMSGFDEFIETRSSICKIPLTQKSFICDLNGKIAISRLLRFETLDRDFSDLCDELGCFNYLTVLNQSRSHGSDYRSHYSKFSRNLVQVTCQEDIDTFSYSF